MASNPNLSAHEIDQLMSESRLSLQNPSISQSLSISIDPKLDILRHSTVTSRACHLCLLLWAQGIPSLGFRASDLVSPFGSTPVRTALFVGLCIGQIRRRNGELFREVLGPAARGTPANQYLHADSRRVDSDVRLPLAQRGGIFGSQQIIPSGFAFLLIEDLHTNDSEGPSARIGVALGFRCLRMELLFIELALGDQPLPSLLLMLWTIIVCYTASSIHVLSVARAISRFHKGVPGENGYNHARRFPQRSQIRSNPAQIIALILTPIRVFTRFGLWVKLVHYLVPCTTPPLSLVS